MTDVDWTWSWSGRCFGYWIGPDLWTYGGKHVGRRRGPEIFAPGGRYLGEIMNSRLVTNNTKAVDRGVPFRAEAARAWLTPPPDLPHLTIYQGYQDFPRCESF